MQYKAFDSYHVGFSHIKNDKPCEDYSISYNDLLNRFFIASISDGHSDKNCFRSAFGSRFACEAARDILVRFCEAYIESDLRYEDLNDMTKERLIKSLKQCWDDKVFQHISENPLTNEELEPLSEKVRNLYISGKALENIYGATFLATVICRDLFIVLHIGDGVIMSITPDGKYVEPIIYDEKSETGEPASICNNDLFSREHAFRCEFFREMPLAVFLTSDGIGDSIDNLQIREFIYTLLSKLSEKKEDGNTIHLNNDQQKYLDSCVSYYTEKGHGVEDDCSIAGIYTEDESIPDVSISLEYAKQLHEESIFEYNAVITDYERRKQETVKEIKGLENQAVNKLCENKLDEWVSVKNKAEELKSILKNIINNETEKKRYLDSKIAVRSNYVSKAGGDVNFAKLAQIEPVDDCIIEEDQDFLSLKKAQAELQRTIMETDKACEEVKKAEKEYKLATREVVKADTPEIRAKAENKAYISHRKRKAAVARYELQELAMKSNKHKVTQELKKIIINVGKKGRKK